MAPIAGTGGYSACTGRPPISLLWTPPLQVPFPPDHHRIVPLKARWLLASRFGILAREVTRSTKPVTLQSQVEDDAPASQAGTKQRYYVLESLVPARLAAAAPLDTGAGPRRALLIAVLSILHLAGGRVDQGVVPWEGSWRVFEPWHFAVSCRAASSNFWLGLPISLLRPTARPRLR